MNNLNYSKNKYDWMADTHLKHSPVAELVDAPDLGSGSERSAGSSPVRVTIDHIGIYPNKGKNLLDKEYEDLHKQLKEIIEKFDVSFVVNGKPWN